MITVKQGLLRLAPLCLLALPTFALASGAPGACARPPAGSVATAPADIFSTKGVLKLALNYETSTDDDGRTLYCFVTPDGLESPTLHVHPGDTMKIALTNQQTIPQQISAPDLVAPPMPGMHMAAQAGACTGSDMSGYSVNMHFHGTNASPKCKSDETIRTIVNPGETFNYSVTIPTDEPPGLYWYHPHVHGISAGAVLGGASGAIVVEGIENLQPKVAKLPERIVVLRDQQVAGNPNPGGRIPSYDVSVDYTPIAYPANTPAIMTVIPGRREFWRVVNASADEISDLQLTYDGVAQTIELVAMDGVPLGSQDGTRTGKTLKATHILLPPAGRAEFIMTSPASNVQDARFETLKIHGGPLQDNNIHRTLALLQAGDDAGLPQRLLPAPSGSSGPQRFEGLDTAPVTAHRRLYFYEIGTAQPHRIGIKPKDTGVFFITVAGQTPEPFDPNAPPAITTTQGAVEDWRIENRTQEVHEFHIHQIHFQVLEISGVPVPASERQFRDTYQVPYWSGHGPYPSITVRMDFRGDVAGDFVYHCHILDHEDLGMMAKIRVLPNPALKHPG